MGGMLAVPCPIHVVPFVDASAVKLLPARVIRSQHGVAIDPTAVPATPVALAVVR